MYVRLVRGVIATLLAAGALAGPSTASAAPGWIPGFDEVTPAANLRTPVAVVTADLRTVVIWGQSFGIHAAVRPRSGTFGEPFEIAPGDINHAQVDPSATALPNGDVLVAWSFSGDNGAFIRVLHPDGTLDNAVDFGLGSSHPTVAVNADGMVAVAYYYFNQVYVTTRAAGSDTFDAPVLLLTLGTGEQRASFDVTLRDDNQIAVAIGTEAINPPGGSARMLIIRRTGTTTSPTELVDSRTLNLTPPPGKTESASYSGLIELLSDGRQMLVYRLDTAPFSGNTAHDLRGGPRDGTGGAPPLVDATNNNATEHGLVVDEDGRPFVWWRKALGDDPGLRVARASTAGAFAGSQLLTSGSFGSVGFDKFGDGRTGLLFTQGGKVQASTSEAGGAFGTPLQVATPGNVPDPPLSPVVLAGAGEGSAVAVWPDGTSYTSFALNATPFDATAPTVSIVQAPASLTAGIVGTFTATAVDDWSAPSLSWLFGDDGTQNGVTVGHAFTDAGSFSVTATATDAVGNTAGEGRTVTVTAAPAPPGQSPSGGSGSADTRAPVLSGVRLVPGTLRRGRRSATLRFSLDEAATVVAQLERARPGFRSGLRCVARRPRRGAAKRCTRFVRSGRAMRRAAVVGAGRLAIRRPRARGRYRVAVYALDAAANRSATQRRALTVR
jgi:hypothetical protein